MNREIKFRAWCTNNENVTYSNGDHMEYDITLVNGKYADVESGWDIHGTHDFPVMQFTGLHDKNGKEIYEGDVVIGNTSYERDSDDYKWTKESPCIVKWSTKNSGFYPFILNNRWRCDVINIEIIGDIYSNPELLNK